MEFLEFQESLEFLKMIFEIPFLLLSPFVVVDLDQSHLGPSSHL